MTRWIMTLAVLATTTVLGGCIPKKIAWSPDGQQAAMVDDDYYLYIIDADGTPWDSAILDVADCLTPVVWLPDSQRILVVRRPLATRWEEVAQFLPSFHEALLIDRAKELGAEILAYEGDWDEFDPPSFVRLTDSEIDAVLLYLHEQPDAQWPESSKQWHNWDEEYSVEVSTIELYECSQGEISDLWVVAGALEETHSMRLSPDGNTLAYTRRDLWVSEADISGREVLNLYVVPTDGEHAPRFVEENVSELPDWSPDGTHLVYAVNDVAFEGDEMGIGSITRRNVCSDDGQLLDEFGDSDELLALAFYPWMRVFCLDDGRILFTTPEIQFPTTTEDIPEQANLFVIDPQRQPTVSRMLPRPVEQQLSDALTIGALELSPDETRLAVASPFGHIVILELASGQVSPVFVADTSQSRDPATLPTWRSNEELCFAVPPGSEPGSENRTEVVLWSEEDDTTRVISNDWRDDMTWQRPDPTP